MSYPRGKTPIERVLLQVEFDPFGGCWLWSGVPNRGGYGFVKDGSRSIAVHRVSYEFHKGPIPDGPGFHGTCVLHQCDRRVCVNPEHLHLGSQRKNILEAEARGRSRHPNGSDNGLAKLTDAAVREIRALLGAGVPQQRIAAQFGVSQTAIGNIKRGATWAHVVSKPASTIA